MFNKLTLGVVIGLMTASIAAQTNIHAKSDYSAYIQDNRGVIVRSGFGLCWRSDFWVSSDAVAGCDGELLPPIVKPTAPEIIFPAANEVPMDAKIAPTEPKLCNFSIHLENDHGFAFDTAVLSKQAKTRLDTDVIAKLSNCNKIETLRISGHTDRLGSQQYNQQLSKKRAEAVANYLKSKGISTNIEIRGMANALPIAECNNKLITEKLINCLAPNRRVEIQVIGKAN